MASLLTPFQQVEQRFTFAHLGIVPALPLRRSREESWSEVHYLLALNPRQHTKTFLCPCAIRLTGEIGYRTLLVGRDLGEGPARGIIDRDMDELIYGPRVSPHLRSPVMRWPKKESAIAFLKAAVAYYAASDTNPLPRVAYRRSPDEIVRA